MCRYATPKLFRGVGGEGRGLPSCSLRTYNFPMYEHRAYAYEHATIYIHTYAYACMHACMYACMYLCMHACMYACMYVCMYVCIYVCMYVCTYVCVYVCMYVCTACLCEGRSTRTRTGDWEICDSAQRDREREREICRVSSVLYRKRSIEGVERSRGAKGYERNIGNPKR